MKKVKYLALASLTTLTALALVSCGKGKENNNTTESASEQNTEITTEPVIDYTGSQLYNGFENNEDLYKLRQHTTMNGSHWNGYSATGKLSIVGATDEVSPVEGDKMLQVYYGGGNLSYISARFSKTEFAKVDVKKIGGFSVDVYNDGNEDKKVTLSLVNKDLSVAQINDNEFTIKAREWTTCKVSFNPVFIDYFADDFVGFCIEFEDKTEAVYYLDNMNISFDLVYTDEMYAQLALVEDLENKIYTNCSATTVTAESRSVLEELYETYLNLPLEYRAIVHNYEVLENAITRYMNIVADEELAKNGRVDVLRYDSILGLGQITEGKGVSISYTKEEHAPGQDGCLKFEFDGKPDWAKVYNSPSMSIYDEVHVWVKNDSELSRVFQITWTTLGKTNGDAYDVDGNLLPDSEATGVNRSNNIIASSNNYDGWVELVFRSEVDLAEFNIASFASGVTNGVGTLYVGKVTTVSKAGTVIELIDSLEEKSTYTDEELAVIGQIQLIVSQLEVLQKSIVGDARLDKFARIIEGQIASVIAVEIKNLPDTTTKTEYSLDDIALINKVKADYDALPVEKREKIDATKLTNCLNVVAKFVNEDENMLVEEYGEEYAQKLQYSVAEVSEGKAYSLLFAQTVGTGSVEYVLPKPIENAKEIKVLFKNASDGTVAFWPALIREEGGTWLTAQAHGVTFANNEGWVELTYTVGKKTVDRLIFTYGPWAEGTLKCYIGGITAVSDESVSKDADVEIAKVKSIAEKTDVTVAELMQLRDVLDLYETLTEDQKELLSSDGKTVMALITAKLDGYSFLRDLTDGNGLKDGVKTAATWSGFYGKTPNQKELKLAFSVKGVDSATTGSLYLSLFYPDNATNMNESSNGLMYYVSKSGMSGGFTFENEMSMSPDKTYYFVVSYKVEDDYSKLTVNIKIYDEDGNTVMDASKVETSIKGSTIEAWVTNERNVYFYLNTGYTSGIEIE